MAPLLASAALWMRRLQFSRASLTEGRAGSESLYGLFIFIGKTPLVLMGFCRKSHPSAGLAFRGNVNQT